MDELNSPPKVFFGGANRKPGILRDLLERHVKKTPAGGRISWLTYYFRDRRLAHALIDAARRGVHVTVTIDKTPRMAHANDQVIALFRKERVPNLKFRAMSHPLGPLRLHSKIYCFSRPAPIAFLGSFNPSGDQPEEYPEIIREIGDHDRGFNMLVGLDRPGLCQDLEDYCLWINRRPAWWIPLLSLRQSRTLRSKDIEISFLPRLLPHPLFHFLDRLDPDAQIKIAASHLKGWAVNKLLKLAARGCRIEIVAESTERRVPKRFEKQLKAAGIRIRRAGLGWQMPMHDKFTLVYWHGMKYSFFGSFNWTTGSMRRNLEVVASSTNPRLHDILEDRWNELSGYS